MPLIAPELHILTSMHDPIRFDPRTSSFASDAAAHPTFDIEVRACYMARSGVHSSRPPRARRASSRVLPAFATS